MTRTTYIVGITTNDDRFHVGTLEDFLPHFGATKEEIQGGADGFEIYDDQGHRMEISTDDDTGLVQLEENSDIDELDDLGKQVLLDRIAAFFARAQVVLDGDVKDDSPRPFDRFPVVLNGRLRETFALLAELFGPLPAANAQAAAPHPGDGAHAWAHAHGLAHK